MTITRRQLGAATIADAILRQKSRYMIVTLNMKGKVVYFDPYDGDAVGPFPFLAVSANDATAVFTNLREAERALNTVKVCLKHAAGDFTTPWAGLDKECVDAICIMRLSIDVEPVRPRSHKKKKPFTGGAGWPARGTDI